ncbi:MAG TPA: UdgX family uracil-DNA binding protein [Solirubrobacteraceae bacterium]|jgi:uracil-DNA glycosylase family protein|nr:UdgX family uracil-DNA binding protein [Solirubrobacteraceae bacterium]
MGAEEGAGAEAFLPERISMRALREAAAGCRGCGLYAKATQTVFGEGRRNARMMLVGEMPGDVEDREGHPFVGPAGRELDRAFATAGIDRRDVYLTNVVKHFKFEERGKRRIHQSPKRAEIDACLPWFDNEIKLVRPRALVLLGAIAAKALLGNDFRLTRHRGELLDVDLAPIVTATIHPAAILRTREDARRHEERRRFAEDLHTAVQALAGAEANTRG